MPDDTPTAASNAGKQIYVKVRDEERLRRLAGLETRRFADQFTVIVDEACRARGLDPETLAPVKKNRM